MKQINIKIILLSAMILMTLQLKAQYQDHIITVKNDTLACIVNQSSREDDYYFRKADMDEPVKIQKGKIKEFYTGDKTIWKRRIYLSGHLAPFYLSVVLRGKISLYEEISTVISSSSFGTFTKSTTLWYVQ